ncbi:MAG: hypothetical protein PW735_07465 [Acidobacteriaceae bacterium]|nr:hypothetical protein [Acidobacteriaceae bacterium]
MALDIIAFLVVASHVLAIGLIILWFGLGKPKSRAELWNHLTRRNMGPRKPARSVVSKV